MPLNRDTQEQLAQCSTNLSLGGAWEETNSPGLRGGQGPVKMVQPIIAAPGPARQPARMSTSVATPMGEDSRHNTTTAELFIPYIVSAVERPTVSPGFN